MQDASRDGSTGGFIPLTPAEAAAELDARRLVECGREEERLRLTAIGRQTARELLRSGWRQTVWWRGVRRRLRRGAEPVDTLPQRIAASGLFAPGWYRRRNACGFTSPLAHFVRHGLAEGLAPNPFFDPAWYLSRHGQLFSRPQSAIEHYLDHGGRQLLAPGPLFDPIAYARQAPTLVFVPDMLAHYLNHGIFKGLTVEPVRIAYLPGT